MNGLAATFHILFSVLVWFPSSTTETMGLNISHRHAMAYTLNDHQVETSQGSLNWYEPYILPEVSQGMIASNATKVKHLHALATQMALCRTPRARVRWRRHRLRPRRIGAGFYCFGSVTVWFDPLKRARDRKKCALFLECKITGR